MKMNKKKQATTEILATITDDCDNILAFLQAVAVNSPQGTAVPLSLRADKRARVWFCWRADTNLPTPTKPVPQDHTALMGVLTDLATRLQTTEAPCPVATGQREA